MTTKPIVIPSISDEELAHRMGRIKFVIEAMVGIDGKAYPTEETNKELYDLFYKESSADPRTQAFNFDEAAKITEKAVGLVVLRTEDIFIKVGGYHGFLKMTMAEVLSQIPEDIADQVVAFGLNPEKDAQVIDGGNHQIASIIFYGKTDEAPADKELPSSEGLLKPIDMDKATRLKEKIKPMVNYRGEGLFSFDPGNIEEPFMNVGIWLRISGSNLHKHNAETQVTLPCKQGQKISVYQAFNATDGADFFRPTYAYTISQIPDELITEKTIGFMYHNTDYFKTKEGVIHETKYTLIEKE